MSVEHPIIAVTGSSGAGTTTIRQTFENMFRRRRLKATYVEGDSFHRFEREEMRQRIQGAESAGKNMSHFGVEANHFDKLEELFRNYAKTGTGQIRRYFHTDAEAMPYGKKAGVFSEWENIPDNTDLLFYEGLHGGLVIENDIDVAHWVDLLIGVVPIVNLEWIQKINRDCSERGYSLEEVRHTILRRMPDYVNYIMPQFSRTHINFQRVPLVDTSNPLIARDIPTQDESLVVIRFNKYREQDYPYLLRMIQGSFMSRPNTLVIPGGKMGFAMQVIFQPIIDRLMESRRQAWR